MNSRKVSAEQKDVMITYLKDKPQMIIGKFSPQFTKADCQKLWEELSVTLNAIPNGACKDWCGWKKTWIDVKKYSKSKLAAVKKYQKGTGGGPPMKPPKNDDFDDKIFELITAVSVSGNENVPQPTIMEDSDIEDTESVYFDDSDKTDQENQELNQKQHTPKNTVETKKGKKIGASASSSWFGEKTRVTKTMRLTESIKNNKQFLEMNSVGLDETKNYRAQKLQYYEQKIACMKSQTESLKGISTAINKLADNVQELF